MLCFVKDVQLEPNKTEDAAKELRYSKPTYFHEYFFLFFILFLFFYFFSLLDFRKNDELAIIECHENVHFKYLTSYIVHYSCISLFCNPRKIIYFTLFLYKPAL